MGIYMCAFLTHDNWSLKMQTEDDTKKPQDSLENDTSGSWHLGSILSIWFSHRKIHFETFLTHSEEPIWSRLPKTAF